MPNLHEYFHLLQNEQAPLSEGQIQELLRSAMQRADIDVMRSPDDHFPNEHFPSEGTTQLSPPMLPSSSVPSLSQASVGVSFTAVTKGIALIVSAASCIAIAYVVHKNINGKDNGKDNATQTLLAESASLQPVPEKRSDVQKESINEMPDKHLKSPMPEDTPHHRFALHNPNRSEANNVAQTAQYQRLLGVESPSANTALEKPVLSSTNIPDSLLPADFQGLAIPSSLAKALVERRLQVALLIADSIVNSAQTGYNYALRGHVQKLLRNSQAAINDYEESLAIEPKAALFLARGLLLLDNNKPQDAWKDFTTALSIDPHDKEALYSRALAAYSLKRFEEACDDWSQSAQLGHFAADSMMSVRCVGYVPNYVRTALSEEKKVVSKIFRRMREIERILNTEHVPANINKIRLDSGSFRQLGAECGTGAALNRNGVGLICSIHYLYRFAYEQQDGILMVYFNNLHKHIVSLALQNSGNGPSPNANNNSALHDDGVNYDQMIAKELQNSGSTEKIQELQSKKVRQTVARNINQLQNEQPPKQPRLQNEEALRVINQAIEYFRDEYKNAIDTIAISSTIQDNELPSLPNSPNLEVAPDSTLREDFRGDEYSHQIKYLMQNQEFTQSVGMADSLFHLTRCATGKYILPSLELISQQPDVQNKFRTPNHIFFLNNLLRRSV